MTVTQDLASDIEVRRSGIGGSDVAAVLGVSKWGTPMSVYMEKVGMSAPTIDTERFLWGRVLEEPIAREFARRTGKRIRRVNRTLRVKGREWLMAHVDRDIPGTDEMLEVKTAHAFAANDFGEPGSDQVPPDYLIQGQHYLGVTRKRVCHLAVLIGGVKYAQYLIPRDDELIEQMWTVVDDFWLNNVVPRVPPPVDGTDASREFLEATYPEEAGEIEMTDELEELAAEYEITMRAIKNAEAAKATIRNQIAELMGAGTIAKRGNVSITYKSRQSPARTDWKEVARVVPIPPAVIQEFTTRAAPQRVVTVAVKEDR